MEQWYTCSNLSCIFESEKFPKETKISAMENVLGTRCKVCGHKLVYNSGLDIPMRSLFKTEDKVKITNIHSKFFNTEGIIDKVLHRSSTGVNYRVTTVENIKLLFHETELAKVITTESFYELYTQGKVTADDLDDYLAAWHKSDSSLPVYEYLGLSQNQYRHWVETGKLTDVILDSELGKSELQLSTCEGASTDIEWLSILARQANEMIKGVPKEKQAEIKLKRDSTKEHKLIESFVQQGLCPYCGANLVRGKKDRKNDYKRSWSCVTCNKTITN